MRRISSLIFLLIAAAVVQLWFFTEQEQIAYSGFIQNLPEPVSESNVPSIKSSFVTPMDFTREAHSASLVPLSSGHIRAVWYGGSEEGAKDVNLYTATYEPSEAHWTSPKVLFSRKGLQTAQKRYVRKIGNPVLGRAPDGALHLFFVSVGIGGWGTSSINHAISGDDGKTWSIPEIKRTSPLLNLGTLVKGKPIWDIEGNIWLPVYNELFGKHAELLVFSGKTGHLIRKTKLVGPDEALQPELVPISQNKAVILSRYAGERPNKMLMQSTESAGKDWSKAEKSSISNPNSAISAVAFKGGILLAFNDHEDERNNLSLSFYREAAGWQPLLVVEGNRDLPEQPDNEFSYPSLIQAKNGDFHLAYTWNK